MRLYCNICISMRRRIQRKISDTYHCPIPVKSRTTPIIYWNYYLIEISIHMPTTIFWVLLVFVVFFSIVWKFPRYFVLVSTEWAEDRNCVQINNLDLRKLCPNLRTCNRNFTYHETSCCKISCKKKFWPKERKDCTKTPVDLIGTTGVTLGSPSLKFPHNSLCWYRPRPAIR